MRRRLASLAVLGLCGVFIRPAAAENPNGPGKPRRNAEIITRPAKGERHPECLAVVDDADNRVNAAYASWPERLVIVDVEGKIAYKGAPGPWGFKPSEVEQWLEKHRR